MKCEVKGCVFPALTDEVRCTNHREKPIIPVVTVKDYEIVALSTVPSFKIKNEKAYALAKVIGTLTADHALKVNLSGTAKENKSLTQSVCAMARKLGWAVRYRSGPRSAWFWKRNDAKKKVA